MLIYRFRVTSQEHEEFVMEIEIQPGQTFLDFHDCIIETAELAPPEKAMFFPTDKKNRKSIEISLKSYKKEEKKYDPELDEMVTVISKPRLMKDLRIKNYIEDPHQRLIYEYYGKVSHAFYVELVKIVQSDGMTLYPVCVKKTGELPKPVTPPLIVDTPKPAQPKPAAPKLDLPPLDVIAKLDEMEEDEEELAKIDENIEEFLSEEEISELSTEEKPEKRTADNDEATDSLFDQGDEDGEDNLDGEGRMEHLEDFEDLDNIDQKYSRYYNEPDDQ